MENRFLRCAQAGLFDLLKRHHSGVADRLPLDLRKERRNADRHVGKHEEREREGVEHLFHAAQRIFFHSVAVVIAPSTKSVKYRLISVCSTETASTAIEPPDVAFAIAAPMFTTTLTPVSTAAGMMFIVMS